MSDILSWVGGFGNYILQNLGIEYVQSNYHNGNVLLIWNPWFDKKLDNSGNPDGFIIRSYLRQMYEDMNIHIYVPLAQSTTANKKTIKFLQSNGFNVCNNSNLSKVFNDSVVICMLSEITESDNVLLSVLKPSNTTESMQDCITNKILLANDNYGIINGLDIGSSFKILQMHDDQYMSNNIEHFDWKKIFSNDELVMFKKYYALKILEYPNFLQLDCLDDLDVSKNNRLEKWINNTFKILHILNKDFGKYHIILYQTLPEKILSIQEFITVIHKLNQTDCPNPNIKNMVAIIWSYMISNVLEFNVDIIIQTKISLDYDNDRIPLFVNKTITCYIDNIFMSLVEGLNKHLST